MLFKETLHKLNKIIRFLNNSTIIFVKLITLKLKHHDTIRIQFQSKREL